jgi:tetratricopeptide (TPR) repeat protein
MRILITALALASLALPSTAARAQELAELTQPPNGDNQKAEVSQWIGPVRITIAYHSPRVHLNGRDRTGHIFGELVKFGMFDDGFGPSRATPWRAGANESTTLTVSDDVKIDGKDLKAGTYALFLEVAKTGPWTWILSRHVGWGSFQYDPKYDALRVAATAAENPFTEFLTYGFDERRTDSAVAYLAWENKRIPLKIDVPNVDELWVARMRQDLESWAGFSYQNWQQAAQFAASKKVNLEEALVWAEKAINEPFRNAVAGQRDFSTLSTKAAVLTAMGRTADADKTMDEAMRLPGTEAMAIHQYGMRLLAAQRKERAMTVFQFNRAQHPSDTFVTYVGLARGYTASGDTKNAIANWEIALKNVPPDQQSNRAVYERALAALKEAK